MGQDTVLDCLRKQPNVWLSSRQLAEQTKTGLSSTTMCLKRLRKSGMVEWSEAKSHNGVPFYVYRYKR